MTGAAPGALDSRLTAVLKDVAKLALTALFALSSGWVFSQFRLPVPYMLGSLIGVWVLGGLIRPAQPWLGVPRWFHIPVILGLGVIVGGAIVYAVKIWSNTQQQRIKAPAEAIQKGVESVKEALQPGS